MIDYNLSDDKQILSTKHTCNFGSNILWQGRHKYLNYQKISKITIKNKSKCVETLPSNILIKNACVEWSKDNSLFINCIIWSQIQEREEMATCFSCSICFIRLPYYKINSHTCVWQIFDNFAIIAYLLVWLHILHI